MSELPINVSRVRVRMYHTDLVGVFHGRIFDLFEEARTEAFRRLGFDVRQTNALGVAFVVTAADTQFREPLTMDEEVEIGVFVSLLTRTRVTIAYEVGKPGGSRPAVTGHTAFVFYDQGRGRPVAVPDSIRAAIARCPEMLRLDSVEA